MTREEAIAWLEYKKDKFTWTEAIDMAIKALNDWTEYSDKLWKIVYERGKVDALEWTPCDEKLPSESGEYLVSYVLLNDEIGTDIAHYGKPLLPLNTNETEIGWYKTDNDGDFYLDDILAWQPLPKPYCPQNDTDIGTTKPKSSICTRCENKEFCKETLRIYGLPNMRVEECKEYKEKPIPTSLLNSEQTVSHEEAWAEPSDLAKPCENIAKDCKTDLISKAEPTNALKETETKEHDDLISRADTLAKIKEYCIDGDSEVQKWFDTMGIEEVINTMPSVSANSGDLIIKNGKGIQDGLYNIKDGELFKYKAKGGTVRAHKLVPSVSAERVDCDSCIYKTMWQEQEKAETLDRHTLDILQERFEAEELKAHAKSSGLKEHAVWNKAIRILEEYMEEGDNDND